MRIKAIQFRGIVRKMHELLTDPRGVYDLRIMDALEAEARDLRKHLTDADWKWLETNF